MKLTTSERHVLSFLIFPETFQQIQEEAGMPYGSLRADLMNLVSHGFIEVWVGDGSRPVSPFYDIDHLEQFAFKATKSGLNKIQRNAI